MNYDIEFEDKGQDLLRITCKEDTGEIIDAGPFHRDIYADGAHFVDVAQLRTNRMVHFRNPETDDTFFKWLMIELKHGGETVLKV
jgi:hypothetical protein